MKKRSFVLLLIGLIAAVLIFSSCDKKGGTIEVTNRAKLNGYNSPTYVIVVEGEEVTSALSKVGSGQGDYLEYGESKTYEFDEDGIYTVVAIPPATGFIKPVLLTLGSKEKVTIE